MPPNRSQNNHKEKPTRVRAFKHADHSYKEGPSWHKHTQKHIPTLFIIKTKGNSGYSWWDDKKTNTGSLKRNKQSEPQIAPQTPKEHQNSLLITSFNSSVEKEAQSLWNLVSWAIYRRDSSLMSCWDYEAPEAPGGHEGPPSHLTGSDTSTALTDLQGTEDTQGITMNNKR